MEYKEETNANGWGTGGFYADGKLHKQGVFDSIWGLINAYNGGASFTTQRIQETIYNYNAAIDTVLSGKYTNSPGWKYGNNPELAGLTLGGTRGTIKITVNTFVHTDISPDTNKFALGSSVVESLLFQYVKLPSKDIGFRFDDYTARTMSILINLEHIMKTLDNNVNKNGEVDVLNFLKKLMNDVEQALGGINNFELSYDDIDNTYRIVDNTYIANSNKENHPELQINTLTREKGTFVQDVSIKTELTARIANAIAAGAQTNGNTGVTNGTTFAKFTDGLTDRVITTKQNANNSGGKNSAYESQALRANELYSFIQKFYKAYGPEVTKEDCQKFGGIAKDLYQYQLGYLTNTNNINGTMFIPLNLQVTVDGISGIKQYQSFATNQELLPADYHNRLAFIVKGLNHKIDKNGWSTVIETLAINKKNQGTEVPNYKVVDVKVVIASGKRYTTPMVIVGDERLKPIKIVVFKGESDSYDSMYPSTHHADVYGGVLATSLTIQQTIDEGSKRVTLGVAGLNGGAPLRSSAIGAYQQLTKYIKDRATAAGLSLTDLYNDVNQEKMGESLLINVTNGYITGTNEGNQTQLEYAVQQLGQIWSSKPIINKTDKLGAGTYGDVTTGMGNVGYYGGDGINPGTVKISVADVVIALIDTRKNMVDNSKVGIGGLPTFTPTYY